MAVQKFFNFALKILMQYVLLQCISEYGLPRQDDPKGQDRTCSCDPRVVTDQQIHQQM